MPKQELTIFTEMSALAIKHNAINLSQGFPDFELSPKLGIYLKEAFDMGYNQYAPMQGLPMLRQSIADTIQKRYHKTICADKHITITPGATYALYNALASFINKNDEVIILEPAYDSYAPNISSLGAQAIRVMLNPHNFSVNWESVKQAITKQTKAIIINTPHNPSGVLWSNDDYTQLKEIVRNTSIKIISDEVYEYLTFDNKTHYSLLQDDELFSRAFIVFSFGKMLQATGWKIGYVIAPEEHTNLFRNAHQYIGFSVSSISQYAIAKYLQDDTSLNTLGSFFEQKRDLLLNAFAPLPFTIPVKSQGSYFQLFSYNGVTNKADKEFAIELTKEAKVASIPISPFYADKTDHKILRFCFAKDDETLLNAAHNLMNFFGVQ